MFIAVWDISGTRPSGSRAWILSPFPFNDARRTLTNPGLLMVSAEALFIKGSLLQFVVDSTTGSTLVDISVDMCEYGHIPHFAVD